jgi:hypothetical protein
MLEEYRFDGGHHIVDVAFGHVGKERQQQNALGRALGIGKIRGPVAYRYFEYFTQRGAFSSKPLTYPPISFTFDKILDPRDHHRT